MKPKIPKKVLAAKPMPTKIITPKNIAGQRLDVFLAKKLKITRSQVQKMIEMEQVFVNRKLPKKAGDNLSDGQIIEIKPGKTIAAASDKKLADKTKFEVKIVADTPDYVVVEKPIGMLVHPTMAGETNTLANFIVKKYPAVKKVGDDPMRPGIVHRLDKEASGLMVIAKTQKMFNHLKEQFKNRTVTKEYMALAHGRIQRDWDEINFPISRSETSDRMAAIPVGEASRGKEAKTEFLVEKQFINFALLRVKIHTGRMHQIRVHLLAYNHPLVGDPLYFQKKQKKVWDERLGRLFLHSTKLGFVDLHGETQEFNSPLPQELDNFLKILK